MAISRTERDQITAIAQKLGMLPNASATTPNPIAETMPRASVTTVTTVNAQTSGTLYMVGLAIPQGQLIAAISVAVGTTAAGTPTHGCLALYNSSLVLLGQSADSAGGAVAASTLYTQSLQTPIITAYSGLYYIGILCVAATAYTLMGSVSATELTNIPPIISATSTSGIATGQAPAPAGALTAVVGIPYAFVS